MQSMPAHTEPDLAAALVEVRAAVPVGARYRHYKNMAHEYEVVGHGLWEATLEPAIIYQALYGDKLTFIRPISDWSAEVSFEGASVPRFSRIA